MLYTVLVAERRDEMLRAMANDDVEARMYFPPAHLQPIFRQQTPARLPVTEELATRMLSIPFHARLTTTDLDAIAGALARSRDADGVTSTPPTAGPR
jgi:dTDP-4-amino-4,6-dideoxygalactose transaminase